jgi:ribonucleoside-diphosphate reductase beta chain
MNKKKIFNEKGIRGTESLINGNTTNLREWNRIKYDWANVMYRNMLNNFWIPEEISLNEDIKQFPLLTDGERNAFDKIISFLNFLDSVQSENLPNLSRYITAAEVSSLLNIQAFQEEIHAQSYSYILDTVTNPVTRDKIYDEWREDSHLLKRNQYIANIYQAFNENASTQNFIRVVVANYILEGIYFYSGFSFSIPLQDRGR